MDRPCDGRGRTIFWSSGHTNGDDVSTDFFDCVGTSHVVRTRQDVDIHVSFLLNQRGGPNVFPYYRESASGRVIFTNLDTGGTYTNSSTVNNRDDKIVDNGDGTITIVAQASGADRWTDKNGRLVLVDSGTFRYSIAIDYHGTPGDVSDDTEVPDSFTIVRDSTGRNIIDRHFCDDLYEFTSP